MFVDLVKINLKAGRGGDGRVNFRKEKYVDRGGPDGGDGGRGGDIVFEVSDDLNNLVDLRYQPILEAENGQNGDKSNRRGKSGQDLVVKVPIGTLVSRDGEILADLVEKGQTAVIARGGDGGFGNAHFKSATRRSPKFGELGEKGEEFEAQVELKIVADVGLVGLPNAGKSTFLSVVTNAKPEIADYEFTTLVPNLGVADIDSASLLLADIPGLIAGASEGKGLGLDFLRHIERTSVILHLIDVYSDDIAQDYTTVRTELEKYAAGLDQRPEIIALTKTEGFDQELLDMQINQLKQVTKSPIFAVSSQAGTNLKPVLRELVKVVAAEKQRRAEEAVETASQDDMPTITLSDQQLFEAWRVDKQKDGVFLVTGAKIEKFAARTDFSNYQAVERLRDIMRKLEISRELTHQGATSESLVQIGETEPFTFEEQD